MMRIDIISVVPELLDSPFSASIVKRAIDKGLAEIHVHNLRKYGLNRYNQVDDYQYGGGAGMVLMCEPLDNAIMDLKKERSYDEVIYLTPDGETLTQPIANTMSSLENIMMICGHYNWRLCAVGRRVGSCHCCRQHHPIDSWRFE